MRSDLRRPAGTPCTSDAKGAQIHPVMIHLNKAPDVTLEFSDGRLPGHSLILGQWSEVLAGAVETLSPQQDHEERLIPMPDTQRDDWLLAAAFMYPVLEAPRVTWDSAEKLLRLADKYGMPALVSRVFSFVRENVSDLHPHQHKASSEQQPQQAPGTTQHPGGSQAAAASTAAALDPVHHPHGCNQCMWRWLLLADRTVQRAVVKACLDQIVRYYKYSCTARNVATLPPALKDRLILKFADMTRTTEAVMECRCGGNHTLCRRSGPPASCLSLDSDMEAGTDSESNSDLDSDSG